MQDANMPRFARTIEELEQEAVKWWPPELSNEEASLSIIPLLLATQDNFISILKLSKESPSQIFDVLRASKFPANLFLKHLVVLADFGGEQIQRLNSNFDSLFPVKEFSKPRCFEFFWGEKKQAYPFKGLPIKGLNNKKLGIDGPGLSTQGQLDGLTEDIAMILLFGANAADPAVSEVLHKCEIGNLLGTDEELERYVRQKYIFVSRITGGAQANTLGQVAQKHVKNYLQNKLPGSYQIIPNGHIEDVTHTDGRTLTTFDMVVRNDSISVAIEVSFQVTTNSTIERKAGQAKPRYDMIHRTGNYIAYVIDGAGNFQRKNAIKTICRYSDCTVAFSEEEFKVLTEFITSVLK